MDPYLSFSANNPSTTFNLDDWIAHTPKDVLAKNFGIDPAVFDHVPKPFPYILNGTVSDGQVADAPPANTNGTSTYTYRTLQHEPEKIGGDGGTFYRIDSTNFPISTTIAATFVTLKPGGLRELHWHPNVSFLRRR